MQPGVLRALEFDRVVEAVRSFALTPMGDERLAALAPEPEPGTVGRLLAATTEAAAVIAKQGAFGLRAAEDLPLTLDALAVDQRALEPLRLLGLAAFLESAWETRSALERAGSCPLLTAMSAGVASFRDEIADARRRIDAGGEVVDDASPALRSLRDRLRRQRTRLRGALEAYLRGRDTAKYLQDHVVTERNGRYVIVVKAEHRGNVPGIVHGTSASGASLFLEPLDTVEINNDIVALIEQEAEEVHRILLELTDRFRLRADDVRRTVDAATALDVVQARARFSELIDGVEPALAPDGTFELLAARHPLLMPAVIDRLALGEDAGEARGRRRTNSPVPVTIRLLPPSSVLLVTGPNTGGKTVALKTAGLLALMAQAGLRIPVAHGSRLPVFRSVFADIGDEQSIEASLSTFSAHITNIASMDRELRTPALVLLDEVGSGTDPIEGGALGVAIIDRLRARGATVVATSHYDALKTYASTTDGVTCAAFGFDAETFAPTYQLVYGTPGRSLALEIAARLGLHPSIIAAARANVSARDAQLAEHLARVDRDMRALEQEQRAVARERQTLRDANERVRQREEALAQREEGSRKRLHEAVEAEVRRARRQVDEVVEALKQRTERMAQGAGRLVATGETGEARREARAALDAIAQQHGAPAAPPPAAAPGRTAAVGDRVAVGGLGIEGTVLSVQGGTVEVDVHGKRMRAPARDVRVVGGGTSHPRVDVHVSLQPRTASLLELNVIGCTVDEAITRTERFLDESLLGDQRSFRVIHGHGTGQLRRGLAAFLRQHPLVASIQPAPPEQGGGGATLVELKA